MIRSSIVKFAAAGLVAGVAVAQAVVAFAAMAPAGPAAVRAEAQIAAAPVGARSETPAAAAEQPASAPRKVRVIKLYDVPPEQTRR